MISIYLDDKPLWTPKDRDKRLLKPTVNLEVNKVGSASFQILPGHQYYDSFIKMKSIITIYQDNKILFKGRVYGNSEDFKKTKTIEVEGLLGYFNDSIVRSYDFKGSVKNYVSFLINQHNSQVEPRQRFKLGNVTVTDNNDYIIRSSTENPTTWSEITSKLINNLGGYIVIRYEDDSNYIDYLKDFTDVATQDIAFSVNLLDLTSDTKADTLATCIIAYGAKNETTGEVVNIKSVNGGLDYVSDPDAVAKYGKIYEVATWDDVTLPSNLLKKAKAYLANKVKISTKLTIKAIDLHLADETIEAFKLGDYVKVYSKPHDLNDKVLLTAYKMDLLSPAYSTITLGMEKSSYLADNIKDNTNRIDIITNQIGDIVNQKTDSIVAQTQTYVNEQIVNSKDETKVYIDNAISSIYPVGSIYLTLNEADPGKYLGGTWEKIEDRFLIGASETYEVGSVGGEAEHMLTVDELPKHTHNITVASSTGIESVGYSSIAKGTIAEESGIGETGDDQPHNNIPPYLAVYIWKRTS